MISRLLRQARYSGERRYPLKRRQRVQGKNSRKRCVPSCGPGVGGQATRFVPVSHRCPYGFGPTPNRFWLTLSLPLGQPHEIGEIGGTGAGSPIEETSEPEPAPPTDPATGGA